MNRKTLNQCAHLDEQIACFFWFASLTGQIMTSTVILFIRLVAPFISLEKVLNYDRRVIC